VKTQELEFADGTPVPDDEVLFNPTPDASYSKETNAWFVALRKRLAGLKKKKPGVAETEPKT
jgi:hypothetical protein